MSQECFVDLKRLIERDLIRLKVRLRDVTSLIFIKVCVCKNAKYKLGHWFRLGIAHYVICSIPNLLFLQIEYI